jgi:hypothetical protein
VEISVTTDENIFLKIFLKVRAQSARIRMTDIQGYRKRWTGFETAIT